MHVSKKENNYFQNHSYFQFTFENNNLKHENEKVSNYFNRQ